MSKPFHDLFASVQSAGLKVGIFCLASVGISQTASAQSDQQFRNMFFNKGYGYCDARKLAKVWRTSPWQAKLIAGRKISWGNMSLLQQDWSRGVQIFRRDGFNCGQGRLQNERRKFTYNDADRVARAWTKSSLTKRG
jgi:hypothetical protein